MSNRVHSVSVNTLDIVDTENLVKQARRFIVDALRAFECNSDGDTPGERRKRIRSHLIQAIDGLECAGMKLEELTDRDATESARPAH